MWEQILKKITVSQSPRQWVQLGGRDASFMRSKKHFPPLESHNSAFSESNKKNDFLSIQFFISSDQGKKITKQKNILNLGNSMDFMLFFWLNLISMAYNISYLEMYKF